MPRNTKYLSIGTYLPLLSILGDAPILGASLTLHAPDAWLVLDDNLVWVLCLFHNLSELL